MKAHLTPEERAAIAAALEAGKVYRASRGESGLPGAYRPDAAGGGRNPGCGGWRGIAAANKALKSLGKRFPRVCTVCGVEFMSLVYNQTACSKACKRERDRARDLAKRSGTTRGVESKCVVCGTRFVVNSLNRVTCSPPCRDARRYTRKHRKATPHV